MAKNPRPHDPPAGRTPDKPPAAARKAAPKSAERRPGSRRKAPEKVARKLVLLVDDEPGILTALAGVLTDEGFRCVATGSGEEAIEIYRKQHPDVVFLDIWLPDRDGLETLQALREIDPLAAVVMMSGHGTASTAVKSIKMGAYDYIEKPLSYAQAVEAVEGALAHRTAAHGGDTSPVLQRTRNRDELRRALAPPPRLGIVERRPVQQRTICENTVIYGLGLHSGSRTGLVLQPLPADSGIHFITLPTDTLIPAYVGSVAETEYATTICRDGQNIRTVEHLLSALHARGVTNLLVKVHGEIPALDGSALEFCRTLEDIGTVAQRRRRQEIIIDRPYEVVGDEGKRLVIEPYDGFSISYRLSYPPPIGVQEFSFELTDFDTYVEQIAPARTFGFMRDLKMMSELGLGTGGRLDNCILVGEDNVINTDLRFPDEFVRHKILDIIGDLYLLGHPIRGKVTAHYTGHRFNILLLRKILESNS